MLLGVTFNALTIYVINARKSLQKTTIASLLFAIAISQFLYSAIGLPIEVARFAKRDALMENDECRYFGFYKKLNLGTTGILLALVGINRALALFNHELGMEWFLVCNYLFLQFVSPRMLLFLFQRTHYFLGNGKEPQL